jgi:hypothetical protein
MKGKHQLLMTFFSGFIFFTVVSCHKSNETKPNLTVKEETVKEESIVNPVINARAIYSDRSVNWENRTNQTTYTFSQAETDFGNVSGWNDSRAFISNGNGGGLSCRITLLPNALSGNGGVIANTDISDGEAYEMDYDVKFHSQFNWSRGGKVGFGFRVGEGNTGGDPGWDGNGGSLRLMWYSPGSNPARVYFQPYVYYKDQPGEFGNSFGKTYPTSGALVKGQWYHVHMYIKSNTGSNTNGRVQIIINGTTVLDQAIRWTTNDNQRLIKNLSFHTFRGGSTSDWEAGSTDYIYYDNLVINKIN